LHLDSSLPYGQPLLVCATITPANGQQRCPFGKLAARHAMPSCGCEREADRFP
jgi:hypothetical protein